MFYKTIGKVFCKTITEVLRGVRHEEAEKGAGVGAHRAALYLTNEF